MKETIMNATRKKTAQAAIQNLSRSKFFPRIHGTLLPVISALLLFVPAALLSAENIRITQVDVNNLLLKGEIGAYVSMGEADSEGLEPADFRVTEADGTELAVLSVEQNVNKDEGIGFLLLIDNSGSMYDESYEGIPRIDHAKAALSSFVAQVSGSKDVLGVLSFNTLLDELAPLGSDPVNISKRIQTLSRPTDDMSYTELYQSLDSSILNFAQVPGRKALIVLSDGENYPFFKNAGKPNPEWGESAVTPDEAQEALWKAGITLYGINFADKRDPDLERVAVSSGGRIFDARNAAELENAYADIRKAIQNEVRLSLKAPAYNASERTLTVKVKGGEDSRKYLVPLLFGAPGTGSILIPILFMLGGLALLVFLYFITFEKPVERPQIQTVDSGMTIALTGNATVIGSSADAQMTIAGNPAIDAEHATIIRDDETGVFTLVSKRRVRVNNNPVTKRELKAGDVIQIEGTSIVFDAPETTQFTKAPKKQKT